MIRETYLDGNEMPIACQEGFDEKETKYSGDLVTEERYLLGGTLHARNTGYAVRVLTYNDAGAQIMEMMLDAEEKPCLCSDGYHVKQTEYDDQGRKVRETFLNTDGAAMALPDGTGEIRYTYDENGKVKETLRVPFEDMAVEGNGAA